MPGQVLVSPDPRLPELRAILRARVRDAAGAIGGDEFDVFFDAVMRDVLVDALRRAGADEGTVWLLDAARAHLVPRFNSGPRAAEFVGKFQQSLRAGMISMVVATEQPICENDLHQNHQQDPSLDRKLGLRTCAMIAVPFYFASDLRGVLSGVCLRPACGGEEPRGFTPEALGILQRAALVLSRLMDHRLWMHCLEMETWD
jgi:hypothetical protein